jgi:hypothetical protein
MKSMKYLFSISIILLISCSSVKTDEEILNISITHSDVNSWLNLMPNDSPSFHITGVVKIKNEESYNIIGINLSEIIILQDNEPLYFIEPVFEPVSTDKTIKKIEAGKVIEYRFMVKNGLEIKPELDPDKIISAKLRFLSREKQFEYIIPDIFIEKAY